MGIEYTLRVEAPDPDRITALIRQLPEVREVPNGFDVGPFGQDGWPTATLSTEPGGVYFCDYGGGIAPLGMLVAWLAGSFGAVTGTEL